MESPSFKPLREIIQRPRTAEQLEILGKTMPIISIITESEVRDDLEKAFLYSVISEKAREEQGVTEKDIKNYITSAYQKLEDYVTLAD